MGRGSVDRGGLAYTIAIKEEFKATLAAFKDGVAESRNAWESLKRSMESPIKVEVTGGAGGIQDVVKAGEAQKRVHKEVAASSKSAAESQKADLEAVAAANVKLTKIIEAQTEASRQARNRTNDDSTIKQIKAETAARKAFDDQIGASIDAITAAHNAGVTAQAKATEEGQSRQRAALKLTEQAHKDLANIIAEQEEKSRVARNKTNDDATIRQINEEIALRKKLEDGISKAIDQAAAQHNSTVDKSQLARLDEEEAKRIQFIATLGEEEAARTRLAAKVDKFFAKESANLDAVSRQQKAEDDRRAAAQAKLDAKTQQKADAADLKKQADAAKDLAKQLDAADGGGNKLLFTFRRLFGVLALFQLVRLVFDKIREAIGQVFVNNAQVEEAVLGIQSLLTASGTLATATGRLTAGTEKFAAANAEARRQVALLRLESLNSAGSFDAILNAFQSALGPGLRAGLTPDQIRGFAVRIGQAAASIGLPQNQLNEEIRSILAGTIQQRTTRIAAVLGITNEDIKREREAGTLAEFLAKKFEAFRLSGEVALNNYSVLVAKVKDALSLTIAQGGKDLFDRTKTTLRSILDSLIQVSDQGVIINPKAVALAGIFLSLLTTMAHEAQAVFGFLTLDDAVESSRKIVGLLNNLIVFAASFGSGFLSALRIGASVFQQIVGYANHILGAFTGLDGAFPLADANAFARTLGVIVGLSFVVKNLGSVLALPFSLLNSSIRAASSALTFVVAGMLELVGATKAAGIAATLLSTPMLILAAAVALVIAAFTSEFVRSIKIGEVSIGTMTEIMKVKFKAATDIIVTYFDDLWAHVQNGSKKSGAGYVLAVDALVSSVNRGVTRLGNALIGDPAELQGQLDKITKGQKDRAATISEQARNSQKNTDARVAALDLERDKIRQLHEEEVKRLKAEDATKPGVTLASLFDKALGSITGIVDKTKLLAGGVDDSKTNVRDLGQSFKDIGATITQNSELLDQLGKVLHDISEKAKDLGDEIRTAETASGSEGFARKIVEVFGAASTETRKAVKEIDQQIKVGTESLAGQTRQAAALRSSITGSFGITAETLDSIVVAGQRINDLELKRQGIEASIGTLIKEQQIAAAKGDTVRANQLQTQINKSKDGSQDLSSQIDILSTAVARTIDSLGLGALDAEKLKTKLIDLVKAEATRAALQSVISKDTEDRAKVEAQILDKAEKQTRLLIIAEQERLRVVNARVEAELRGAKFVQQGATATQGINGPLPGVQNESVRAFAQDLASLTILQQKVAEARRLFTIEAQIQQNRINDTKDERTRLELQKALDSAAEGFNLGLEKAHVEATAIEQDMRRIKRVLEEPAKTGFLHALEEFKANAEDTFTTFYNIGKTSIEALSDFISGSLAGALDPNNNQTIMQRFDAFIQAIVNEISKAFVKLFIVKALLDGVGLGENSAGDLAAASAAAASALSAAVSAAASAALAQAALAEIIALKATDSVSSFSSFGFYHGGSITSAHAHAQGLASGGLARPSNLHPSDTVPIWAAVGEFMEPVSSVMAYGRDLFEAFRTHQIDPQLARMLLNSNRASRSVVTATGPGYAAGGSIRAHTSTGNQPIALTIVNIDDPNKLPGEIASRNGQRLVSNVVAANTRRYQSVRT